MTKVEEKRIKYLNKIIQKLRSKISQRDYVIKGYKLRLRHIQKQIDMIIENPYGMNKIHRKKKKGKI